MARKRAIGVTDEQLIRLAQAAKQAGKTGAEFRESVRVKGGYSSDAAVQQKIFNYRRSVEDAMEATTDKSELAIGQRLLDLLTFERAERKGNPLTMFRVSADGVLRKAGDPANGLNLADESEESEESPE